MVEDCKRYGTLPFAGIARSAFIATQILNSFVKESQISIKDKEKILCSFESIAKVILNDSKALDKEKFLKKYGHLRPGTYDILSSSYEEDYDLYFNSTCDQVTHETISYESIRPIINKLDTSSLGFSKEEIYKFIKLSIEGREYAKFVFTKSVHHILKLVSEIGERFGFSKEDMSYIKINSLLELHSSVDHQDLYKFLKMKLQKAKLF